MRALPGIGLRLRRELVGTGRKLRSVLGGNGTTYVSQRVDEYEAYWSQAARLLGAEFTTLAPGLWEVRRGGRRARIANYVVSLDDPVTLRVAGNKRLCYAMAGELGVPVPEHCVFTLATLPSARDFVESHPGPFVVKPVAGSSSGLGVSTHLRDWRDVERAALLASLLDREFLIERMTLGESCRLLFLDGELIHAVRRRGVPSSHGQTRELRTVYDEAVTEQVCPELAAELAAVVGRVGSRFAGVDILTNDLSRPLSESDGVFLEVNTTPGIHHHYQSAVDRESHPVAVRVLERLLATGRLASPAVVRDEESAPAVLGL